MVKLTWKLWRHNLTTSGEEKNSPKISTWDLVRSHHRGELTCEDGSLIGLAVHEINYFQNLNLAISSIMPA